MKKPTLLLPPSRHFKNILRRTGFVLLAALLLVCYARVDGFTLVEWWRDRHSGVVLWHSLKTPAPNDAKVVALTIDDGPDPRYTPHVLDLLQRSHVKATFFVEGRNVRAYPELARRILAQGHSIGNHTNTHPYLNRLSAQQVEAEISGCDRELQTRLGLRTHLFRPPRGLWNPTIYRAAQRDHDHIILWSVALEHHDAPTPTQMADRALRLLRPGGILLLHDGGSASRETTLQALPLVLKGLEAKGYHCVTIPELLKIKGDEDNSPPAALETQRHREGI